MLIVYFCIFVLVLSTELVVQLWGIRTSYAKHPVLLRAVLFCLGVLLAITTYLFIAEFLSFSLSSIPWYAYCLLGFFALLNGYSSAFVAPKRWEWVQRRMHKRNNC